MGINMSHSALLNKKPSYKVSEYTYDTKSKVYSRSYMLQKLHEFNHSIREVRKYLKEEVIDNPIIDKNIVPIYNRFQSVVDQTAQAVKFLKDTTAVAIEEANLRISDILGVEKDPIEDKYSLFERGRMIASTTGYTVPSYRDLNITSELLDPKFPDVTILSNSKLYETLNLLCNSQSSRNTEANEAKANQLISDLQDIKSLMIDEAFRNYTQYSEFVLGNSVTMAYNVFGKMNVLGEDVPLTEALYSQACDNIIKIKEAQNNLEIMLADYNREYSLIDIQFQTILKNVNEFMGKDNVLTKDDDKYAGIKRVIAIAFENGLNTVSALVTINFALLIYKLNRLVSITENCQQIRNIGNYAIKKSLGLAESCQDYKCNGSIFNGLESLGKLTETQENIAASFIILEEMLECNDMNSYGILLEDDTADKKAGVLGFIQKIWDEIVKLWTGFNQTLLDARDERFWKANLEKIKNSDISTVSVNDWQPYPLSIFKATSENISKTKISNFININKLSPDANKSEVPAPEEVSNQMIDEVFKAYNSVLTDDDKKKSFTERINKIFAGGEVIANQIQLKDSQANFDRNTLYTFIDDYIKGNIKKYNNKIKEYSESEKKVIDSSYNNWKSKVTPPQQTTTPLQGAKTNALPKASQQSQQGQQPTANAAQQSAANPTGKGAPQAAATKVQESFLYPSGQIIEEFDLAQVLGIRSALHEVNNVVVPKDSGTNFVNVMNNGRSNEFTGPIDAVTKVYMQNMIQIISAMMSHSLKAFRQYTQLYRLIYQEANKAAQAERAAQQQQQ